MRRFPLFLLFSTLLGLLSVNLLTAPYEAAAQETPSETPGAVLQLVDRDPLEGQPLSSDQPLTLYFDHELNCSTAQSAFSIAPEINGELSCEGTALTFTPSEAYVDGTTYQVTISDALQGADSAQLIETLLVDFTASSSLRVTTTIPTADATDAAADSILTIIFDRPVVPLGIPGTSAELPDPVTIEPEIEGQGEWLNTSVYTFTPEIGWGGGVTYTITVDDVTAVDESSLAEPFSFSFTVALPEIIETVPEGGTTNVRLDSPIQMRFNQPLDRESLEANFFLRPQGLDVTLPGSFEWAGDDAGFMFTPDEPLELDTNYAYGFAEDSVRAANSDATLPSYTTSFRTVPLPAIISTEPADGTTLVMGQAYNGIILYFASPMDPETLREHIIIEPAPAIEPDYFYREWNDSYAISFNIEPATEYTVTIEPGMADIYGNIIDEPLTFSFTTSDFESEFSLRVPSGQVGFYNAYRDSTELFTTHRNISAIDLQLYNVPVGRFLEAVASDSYYDLTNRYQIMNQDLVRAWRLPTSAPTNVLRYDLLDLGNPNAGENIPGGRAGQPVDCPTALPSRANVGDQAVAIAEPALRARSQPPDGEVLESLYPGYAFPIVEGPICANNILWWGITLRDGRTGWVAEGLDNEYYFDITLDAPAPPTPDPAETVTLTGGALPAGVYLLTANTPETAERGLNEQRHFMVVGTANLTLKNTNTEALVWATDVNTGQPLPNVMVSLYGAGDTPIAQATDESGLARFDINRSPDDSMPLAAVIDDGTNFGMVTSYWTEGIDLWRFDIPYSSFTYRYKTYMYTDRPVYRPGQTVYYRGTVRLNNDLIYTLPDFTTLPIRVTDSFGNVVEETEVAINEYGSFNGEIQLAEGAPLGGYSIQADPPSASEFYPESTSIFFDVAEYRLPEYQVNLVAENDEVLQGEDIQVAVNASYFFGGSVQNANVDYSVTSTSYTFNYTGDGRYTFSNVYEEDNDEPFFGFMEQISNGTGTTDANGQFVIEIPAELLNENTSATWQFEASVRDDSGQTISGRTSVIVHRGLVYVGVTPENYVGSAGLASTINLTTVDWNSQSVSGQSIEVEIFERNWSSVQTLDRTSGQITYDSEVEEVPVAQGTVTTDADGRATFEYTPPRAGTYRIRATTTDSEGNVVTSSEVQWVSGTEYVSWQATNNNSIEIITDRQSYEVGDTARLLIASPYQGSAEALITVERGGVLLAERVTIDSSAYTYELPVLENYAPNVFVSVFIVKGVDENNPVASFRFGVAQLNVSTERKQLTIDLVPDQDTVGPGDTVTYTIRTTNYEGEGVPAEVGLSLVDLASLTIGTPNSVPILEAFYGLQWLSVVTSSELTINVDYITQFVLDVVKGGGGGGGDGGIFEIREDLPETAFWEPSFRTDENGTGTFSVTLPDNLTTWRLDARAISNGPDGTLLVGQTTTDIVSTKPLLVRPVTPRFFVVGDEVVLAAVINNNGDAAQSVEATIEANGVTLEGENAQTVEVPAGGTARVEWPVTVDAVEGVELIFYVEGEDGELDATRPAVGQGENLIIPVYRYEAPDFVGTGGTLRDEGSRTERIVLPERFDVSDAQITVKLEPSLAATTLDGLEVLESSPYENIEVTISRLLPNVATYSALQSLNVNQPELTAELRTDITLSIQQLASQQKPDGGWGWFTRDESNPLVTAYALYALVVARDAGLPVSQYIVDTAVTYIQGQLGNTTSIACQNYNPLDRQAFYLFVLSAAGSPDNAAMSNLFEQRENLSIYAQALLAQALDPADTTRIDTLLDDIFSEAITSANGVHWEEAELDVCNWESDTRTTAIVLNAMLEYRPENELLPNVVRWLMVARQGDVWETTQETAWAITALSRWMSATGELNPTYGYGLTVNGEVIVEEAADPQSLEAQVFELIAEPSNDLRFARTAGDGALYYTAYLQAYLPVPEIEPVSRGIIVDREYRVPGSDETVTGASIGDVVEVHLTIVAPNDLYYLVVDDPLPAGVEAIDPGLATSQTVGTRPVVNPGDEPDDIGYGWWWFSDTQFYSNRVVLSATYLPAGTYEYVYTVRPSVEGTYSVIPPTAREFYFPEVYGRGAGSTFSVVAAED
jgi:alpha-2-macroglobulin